MSGMKFIRLALGLTAAFCLTTNSMASEVCTTEVQVDQIEVEISNCSDAGPQVCDVEFSLANTRHFASSTLCPISNTTVGNSVFRTQMTDLLAPGTYIFEGVLVFAPGSDFYLSEFDGLLTPKFY